ncbi:hypothetical protein CRM22_005441 [Opisthorchis felineus]|uniref:J domain-containing protein n=1 Tax=Opisthorchis felineus TaxID=147828 RepID=A0A4S2LR20_OPIFE|nr:hypothetical protein CRM22_005441 [Opisthorchis felineus]
MLRTAFTILRYQPIGSTHHYAFSRRYATQTKVKDYYSVLQVKPTASQVEIKNAYLELSKKYHPDTAAPNSNSKSRFVDLTEAYSVLGKIESRREYDACRKLLDLGLVGDGFRMYYPKPDGELDAVALEAYQDEMRRRWYEQLGEWTRAHGAYELERGVMMDPVSDVQPEPSPSAIAENETRSYIIFATFSMLVVGSYVYYVFG